MKIITRQWLHDHTNSGCLNASQARALGIRFPAHSGWMRELEGTEIDDERARRFECARYPKQLSFG